MYTHYFALRKKQIVKTEEATQQTKKVLHNEVNTFSNVIGKCCLNDGNEKRPLIRFSDTVTLCRKQIWFKKIDFICCILTIDHELMMQKKTEKETYQTYRFVINCFFGS